MLGPLTLNSGDLFHSKAIWSRGSVHSHYIYVVLVASTFRLGKFSFAAVHIALSCFTFICETSTWILFVCSYLARPPYTSLRESNLITRLLVPTKASIARSKSAASLSVPGKDTPGNRHRAESPKVLVFALKKQVRGAWVAPSVEHLLSVFGSGHNPPGILGSGPCQALHSGSLLRSSFAPLHSCFSLSNK